MPTTQQKHRAREYETIYILRPDVDSESADKVAHRVSDVITRLDGKLVKVDQWGKRKLAYAVKKHSRGIYVYVKYLGYSNMVAEIERNLRMLDPVVKFQTVVTNPNIDPSTVEVDPEEVKFRQIEVSADEPEIGIEQRLGLVPQEEPSRGSSMSEPPPPAEDVEDAGAAAAAGAATAAVAPSEGTAGEGEP